MENKDSPHQKWTLLLMEILVNLNPKTKNNPGKFPLAKG